MIERRKSRPIIIVVLQTPPANIITIMICPNSDWPYELL
jgi:hypothetical protein